MSPNSGRVSVSEGEGTGGTSTGGGVGGEGVGEAGDVGEATILY